MSIDLDVRGHTLVIRLDRPQARNAFDRAQALELSAALDRLDSEDELRVEVLTGGPEFFSAGTDLKALGAGASPMLEDRGYYGMLRRPSAKPMIAAVEGYALGGGLELALGCDLVVASSSARFGLPEVKRGVIASAGGLFRLPHRIPYHHAMELALTGEPVDAATMHGYGLLNRVVAPGTTLDAALELAEQVAANAPIAVVASARGIRASSGLDDAGGWELTDELLEPVLASEDMREGITAFVEKRDPRWSGR